MKKRVIRRKKSRCPSDDPIAIAMRYLAVCFGLPSLVYGTVTLAAPEMLARALEAPETTQEAIDYMEGVEIVEVKENVPVDVQGQPTQYQKDGAAIVCLERFEGSEASQCYKDILAIAYIESRWNNIAIGDGGASWGPFQIYTNVHRHVTWDQATDFRWAARWTLDRIMKHGYPENRAWGIGVHNSMTPEINARYSALVRAVADSIE